MFNSLMFLHFGTVMLTAVSLLVNKLYILNSHVRALFWFHKNDVFFKNWNISDNMVARHDGVSWLQAWQRRAMRIDLTGRWKLVQIQIRERITNNAQDLRTFCLMNIACLDRDNSLKVILYLMGLHSSFGGFFSSFVDLCCVDFSWQEHSLSAFLHLGSSLSS